MPELDLVTVPDVHLCSVGKWLVGQGPEVDPATGHPVWTVTTDDLAAIVEAAQDPGIRTPIVKLGHQDRRTMIDMPAVGRIENLRLSDDGMDLYGDLVGVPRWFAEAMPSAYPSRSVEVALDYTGSTGHTHKAVLTALALLGETTPAIESLDDVKALYEGQYEELVAAASAGGAHPVTLEAPLPKALASVSIDKVRGTFYDKLPDGSWAWIRECWSDFLIVDNDEGALYRVPWSEGANGEVEFGDPIRVVVEYVEAPASAEANEKLMLARFVAKDPELIRRVAASKPGGGPMPYPKEVLDRLGLSEDASDEDVSAAILSAVPEAAADPAPASDPAPAAAPLPDGTVAIDAEALATLRRDAALGRQAHVTIAERDRDAALDAAVKAGKFPPARRDHWKALWDKDPEGTRSTIAELASGLVPVGDGAGHSGSIEDMSDEALYAALFGSEA